MTVKFPSTGLNNTPHSCIFTHVELRRILSVYGEGVLTNHWKDYALSCEKHQTTFCVVEHGSAAGVSFSISRTHGQKGRDYYRVYDGERQIFRGEEFSAALSVFRACSKHSPR